MGNLGEMNLQEVILRGQWVYLEPLRPGHVSLLYPDAMEPGIFQHLDDAAEPSRADLAAWIARRLDEQAKGLGIPFLQRDAVTHKAFGCTAMFNISTAHHRLEIGHTWLSKSHRKTPANTEAKLLLLTHAFETMDAVRVQFKVDERNEAGIHALERIGAVREGLMRSERIMADGFIRNAFVYSIINPEWTEVKKRLSGLLWNRPAMTQYQKPAPPKVPGLDEKLTPPPGMPVFAPYNPPSVRSRQVKGK